MRPTCPAKSPAQTSKYRPYPRAKLDGVWKSVQVFGACTDAPSAQQVEEFLPGVFQSGIKLVWNDGREYVGSDVFGGHPGQRILVSRAFRTGDGEASVSAERDTRPVREVDELFHTERNAPWTVPRFTFGN